MYRVVSHILYWGCKTGQQWDWNWAKSAIKYLSGSGIDLVHFCCHFMWAWLDWSFRIRFVLMLNAENEHFKAVSFQKIPVILMYTLDYQSENNMQDLSSQESRSERPKVLKHRRRKLYFASTPFFIRLGVFLFLFLPFSLFFLPSHALFFLHTSPIYCIFPDRWFYMFIFIPVNEEVLFFWPLENIHTQR